jgi:hypothetical protein
LVRHRTCSQRDNTSLLAISPNSDELGNAEPVAPPNHAGPESSPAIPAYLALRVG